MPSLQALAKEAMNKKKTSTEKAVTPAKPIPSIKSTEYVQDSDEDDEDAKSASDSSSSDDSLPAKVVPALPKVNGKKQNATDSSSSSSESESADESSSDESGDEEDSSAENPEVSKVIEPTRQTAKSSRTTVSFEKPPLYTPPAGFDSASVDSAPEFSELFSKSNLEEKQIWYITAPAAVSVSSIGHVALRDIEKGRTVLSHKDNDYGLTEDVAEDKSHSNVMVPSSSDDGYRAVSKPINQILHLQQIVKLPAVEETSNSGSARPLAKKPIRQQPPGLKMRFRPIGFGDGSTGKIGSSSSSLAGSSDESILDQNFSKPTVDFDSASDSSSDVEMTDLPPPPPQMSEKTSKSKNAGESSTIGGPLKRKHIEGSASKAKKNSSSQSTITTDHKQLNHKKLRQTESQKIIPDSRLVSTEYEKSNAILPPLRSTPIYERAGLILSTSPIPPPSCLTPLRPTNIANPPGSTTPIRPAVPPKTNPPLRQLGSASSASDLPKGDIKNKASRAEMSDAHDINLSDKQRRRQIEKRSRNDSSSTPKTSHQQLSLSTSINTSGSRSRETPIPIPTPRLSISQSPIRGSSTQAQSRQVSGSQLEPKSQHKRKGDKKKRKKEEM